MQGFIPSKVRALSWERVHVRMRPNWGGMPLVRPLSRKDISTREPFDRDGRLQVDQLALFRWPVFQAVEAKMSPILLHRRNQSHRISGWNFNGQSVEGDTAMPKSTYFVQECPTCGRS